MSLKNHGAVQTLEEAPANYFVDPTARIDQPTKVGPGTHIWHFSHVMPNCVIGENCNMGQNVHVASGVRIGNNVKIQNNVSLYTGVELEDDVFCGPSMVFTNVTNPRSFINRKSEYKRTLVRRGASLGANSTVVCGVTIGLLRFDRRWRRGDKRRPHYALFMGVPAKQVGWVCYCGERPAAGPSRQCMHCGRHYQIERGKCSETSAGSELCELAHATQNTLTIRSPHLGDQQNCRNAERIEPSFAP